MTANPLAAAPAQDDDITVLIDTDDPDAVHVDPETGATEIRLPDGRVVVNLDDARRKRDVTDDAEGHLENIAEDMPDEELSLIAEQLIEAIEADDRSRQQWLQDRNKGLDLLGLKLEDPRSGLSDTAAPLEGMSSVRSPLLLEAVLRGWANAIGELLPAEGPVKVRDEGSAPPPKPEEKAAAEAAGQELPPTEDDLAVALVKDMNYYLTTVATEYYPDTQHMLLWGTHFGGSGFKKVYRCPMRQRPVSESVQPEHFIMSDATKDMKKSARLTHVIEMSPSVMKRMKLAGAYRDIETTQPGMDQPTSVVDNKLAMIEGINIRRERPEDQPFIVYETQCELDLDEYAPLRFKGKGIPIPYLVSIDKDSRQILSLRRDWKRDDENCLRKQLYVKYPYVPGPGAYGTGLLQILGNCSAAMTAAWRMGLDAGMFASFPAFMYLKALGKQLTNDFRAGPGQGIPIDAPAGMMNINQAVSPLPFHDVTPGLMTMQDKILQQAQRVGNTAELQVGEGRADVPVGTTLANIEQATKVMAAAHKGMHSAQGEELQLFADLFREYPEDFWRFNKKCATQWDQDKFISALDDCKLVPVSDPNTPSQMHRLMRCVALKQLQAANPTLYDGREVDTTILMAIGWTNPERFFAAPQAAAPPPLGDQARMIDAQAKTKKVDFDMANATSAQRLKMAELQMQMRLAEMDLEKERIIHAHDADRAARADRLAAVESFAGHGLSTQQHGLEQRKQALAEQKAQHDAMMAQQQHALNVGQAAHEATLAHRQHGLEAARAAHEAEMARRQHALDVHQVLHPPKPEPKGKT